MPSSPRRVEKLKYLAHLMSRPTVSFMATPLGSDVFKKIFEDNQSKIFAERIMSPVPMITRLGPTEASRHWDWKAIQDSVIVMPETKSVFEPYILKPGEIVFDEYGDMKKDAWDAITRSTSEKAWSKTYEGSFSTAKEGSEPLTSRHINEAMEKLGMPATRKRLPKKKKIRGDPRRANYSARQFGNILLSMTKDIINNTTLNDELLNAETIPSVHELISPIFEEFFLAHGDKWQITGPMRLSAQSVETGKWKSVSALGGEILHYKSMEIGTRDGVCILWETGSIVGMKEEMIINTTIKSFGSKIVQAELKGNPANRQTLVDLILNYAGDKDIVEEASLAKVRIETIAQEKRLEELERKSAAYGKEFGLWA